MTVSLVRAKAADTLFRALNRVRGNLKKLVPFGSILESIVPPRHNPSFDPAVPTIDVDAFLFDDDDVDQLVEQGRLSRHYCLDCKSTKTADTQFISHSFSRDQLAYLFCYALPHAIQLQASSPVSERRRFSLCDVGSRLGVVLASAALLSHEGPTGSSLQFSRLVGLELNPQLCQIQQQLFSKTRLPANAPSVELHSIDAVSAGGLAALGSCDIVVLHNVFEWFQEESKQLSVWRDLRRAICRPNQIIVAVPTLEESIAHLDAAFGSSDASWSQLQGGMKEFIAQWVTKVELTACVDAYGRELLRYGETVSCPTDEDPDDKAAREEVMELIGLINIYVVRGGES
jgi:hypothetical protein